MNVAEFDTGPLSWVRGEIGEALAQAKVFFARVAAQPAEPGQLRFAATHLHQASGAVRMVGLEGVARVVDEIEHLARAIAQGEVKASPEHASLMERTAASVERFLDGVLEQAQASELSLFPDYRSLARAAGRKDAREVDLFHPDLGVRPPRAPATEAVPAFDLPALARNARKTFQRGLLAFLKGDATGVASMRDAIGGVFQAMPQSAARSFWWSAGALLECVAAGGVKVDLDVKHLLSRLDLQLRRLAEGSQKVAERLHREVLFHVATSGVLPVGAAEVAQAYALENYRVTSPSTPIPDNQRAVLRTLRERLEPMKEAWIKLAGGHRGSVALFTAQIASFAREAEGLRNGALSRLVEATAEGAAQAGSATIVPERAATEVAAALLFLENTLDRYEHLTGEFVAQADAEVARLEAMTAGTDAAAHGAEPLLDEYSRRAQEQMAVSRVVVEMKANLKTAEESLDRFFRDPGQRTGLAGVEPLLVQVDGALKVLDLPDAVELLGHARRRIAELADPLTTPEPQTLAEVADALSALGLYLDTLRQGRPDTDMIGPVLRKLSGEIETVIEAPAETLERAMEQERASLAEQLKGWADGNAAARADLAETAARLREDAELTADVELKRKAGALKALMESAGDAPNAKVAHAVAELAGAPAPAPEATPLPADEAVDAELLQVYLEEAGEVLACIAEHVPKLSAAPHDQDALAVIRRSFHTLKGSGRMVGLTDLGEVAWGIEQLLNEWLDLSLAATAELLSVIQAAHDAYRGWVTELTVSGRAHVDAGELLARADALMRGSGMGEQTTAPEPEVLEIEAAQAPPGVEEIELVAAEESIEAAFEPAAMPEPEPAPTETLLSVFLAEAASHLRTLGGLRASSVDPTLDESHLRAAHTLGGIAATAGFPPLSDLAHALEDLLAAAQAHPGRLASARGVVTDAVDRLVDMVSVAGTAAMNEADDLIARLHAVADAPEARIEAPAETPAIEEVAVAREPVSEVAPAPVSAAEPVVETAAGREAPAETPVTPEAQPAAEAEILPTPVSIAPQSVVPAVAMAEAEAPPADVRRIGDDLDPELLPVFLEEAQELVPQVGASLRAWRAKPDNPPALQALQRALHTLKGSARMAGAMRLGELTHVMEARVVAAVDDPSLGAEMLVLLEGEFDRLADDMERLSGREAELAPPPEAEAEAAAAEAAPQLAEGLPEAAVSAPRVLRVRADTVDRLVNEAGEVAISRSRVEGEVTAFRQALSDLGDNVARLRRQLREIEIQAESQMQSRLGDLQSPSGEFDPLEFDRYTRLQELTRFMAESVSDLSTLQQGLRGSLNEAEAALTAQARMTRSLQQSLMRVRMVPIGSLAERLYRVVRQAAYDTGRQAQLDLVGARVEMDRGVLERLAAPLEHLLRNAVAHGIESADARAAAGKPALGSIRLEARQEGNEVVLVLSDDGAGLNYAAIAERARALGLVGPGAVETELAQVIFMSGFSTAGEVTRVAGRGVGLDVVKSEIAGLGGRVDVASEPGRGTRFTVRLPLTLAVTQALLLTAAGRTYAVPATLVEQVMQLKPADLSRVREAGAMEWNGNRYPLQYLPRLLGYVVEDPAPARYTPIVLLRSGAEHAAVRADELVGNREVVVKNIGAQLARLPGVAGATVLGDGRIVLILNLVPLSRGAATAPSPPPAAPVAMAPLVMVVDDSLTVRKITSRLLTREGYRVLTAKDGVEALQAVRDIRPDAMLLDLEMPRMDGFELARNLRASPATADIPIIIITSRTAEKHRNYARQIGVNEYLGKPYQEDELLKLVARYVGRA